MGEGRILEDRTAIVYGAGGSVGNAIARAYHRAGAHVFLAGRGREALERAAGDMCAGVEIDIVDAGAPRSVADHMKKVVQASGRVDIVFNAVTYGDVQGQSLADLDLGIFADRIQRTVMAQYAVAQCAARHMIKQGSGLISTITGHGQPWPGMGTTTVSWGLVEAMLRQWAVDLGPHGVRVAWLRTGGFWESVTGNRDYGSSYTGDAGADEVVASLSEATMLKALPSVGEAGRAAVYLASAEQVTATAINLTAGAMAD
jgi:3-oxoacyl-[acyl-carrier protein] reductase